MAGPSGVSQSRMSAKAKGKMRTPSWDGRSAFHHQQTPHACPPQSICSSISLPSAATSPASSSGAVIKKATSTSARVKNDLLEKLSDFTRETNNRIEDKEDQRTRRFVAKMNYAVRDKELEMQRNQMTEERTNAEAIHHCELVRMQKDIKLKKAEESCVARQVEMLQLQIQLERLQQKGQSSLSGSQN
jgi:DNA-binding helix-hairpin-helix protein with protein kinase domain